MATLVLIIGQVLWDDVCAGVEAVDSLDSEFPEPGGGIEAGCEAGEYCHIKGLA